MRGLKPFHGKEKEEYDDLTAKEEIILIKNGILPPISPTKEETAWRRRLAQKLIRETSEQEQDMSTQEIIRCDRCQKKFDRSRLHIHLKVGQRGREGGNEGGFEFCPDCSSNFWKWKTEWQWYRSNARHECGDPGPIPGTEYLD